MHSTTSTVELTIRNVLVSIASTVSETPRAEPTGAAAASQRKTAVKVQKCSAATRALQRKQTVGNVAPGLLDLASQTNGLRDIKIKASTPRTRHDDDG